MIDVIGSNPGRPLFVLSGKHISYVMHVIGNGQLEHLYFGPQISVSGPDGLCEVHEFR